MMEIALTIITLAILGWFGARVCARDKKTRAAPKDDCSCDEKPTKPS